MKCKECKGCADCKEKEAVFFVPAADSESRVQRVDKSTRDAISATGKPVFDTFSEAFYFDVK